MKIQLKAGTDAQTIAEIHRRLCIAHRAVLDIIRFYPPNEKTPIKTATQDDILRIADRIQCAGVSLEEPFNAMAGSEAPLSRMDYGADYWLHWLQNQG